MPTLSSPVESQVVITTTSGATSDDKLISWSFYIFGATKARCKITPGEIVGLPHSMTQLTNNKLHNSHDQCRHLFIVVVVSIMGQYPRLDQMSEAGVSNDISEPDDVIKWKHFPRTWPFVRGIYRSPVTSPHKGQWHGALMFSLICAWINSWVNNR